jgi:phosphoglycolate phosphatase
MMKKSCIFFDLDGTLLDSRERLYKLFDHLVPENVLDFDRYWQIKREQKGHSFLLREYYHYSQDTITNFEEKWLSEIEQSQWLQYDKPFDWVDELLDDLHSKYKLYIVTARQSEKAVKKQLSQYAWIKHLTDILVTEQKNEKCDLINSFSINKDSSWFVGDTGKDIQAGQKLGIKTAGVLTGFRSRESLQKYNPDVIVENANALRTIL